MKTILLAFAVSSLCLSSFCDTNEVEHVCKHHNHGGKVAVRCGGKVGVTEKARKIRENRKAPRKLTDEERKSLLEKYRKIAAEKKARKGK